MGHKHNRGLIRTDQREKKIRLIPQISQIIPDELHASLNNKIDNKK